MKTNKPVLMATTILFFFSLAINVSQAATVKEDARVKAITSCTDLSKMKEDHGVVGGQ
jgi:hypothetical protein